MKKIILSIGTFALAGLSFGQQRMVLAESFSQASCGPCAAENPALTTLLNANTAKIVAVKYQVSWPGFDPMYNQNPSEIDARTDYYGITGVPDRVQDGTNVDITQTTINNRYAIASPVNMTISHSISSDFTTADITVTIDAPAIWNPATTVLQLAMVERDINFASAPGSNGETAFHNVMRKMVPNANGTPVVASNFSTAGGTQTFTFTGVALPSYIYKIGEIAFVAWVQNNTTKEVYQAGYSEPLILNDFGIVSALAIPNSLNCDSDLSGANATLKNDGGTVITSATVNYKIDNGTIQTAPFTGNIAIGGTANFNIPTTAISASGAHVLTTYLTDINGSGATTPLGTTTKQFARITANGTTGSFSQNFSSSAFPYANYFVNSETGDNWVRSTTNGGSIKFNNYSYEAGKIGEVTLAPINLSTNTNKAMTFDVAYSQYQTEDDRLEVLVSNDCGATWTSVYEKAGSGLATVPAQTASFVPTSAQWRNESVNLNSFGSSTKLFVKFKATSDWGNNVYVDNINMGGFLGLSEENTIALNVYPNPATSNLTVSFNATGNYTSTITDLQGRTVASQANNASGAENVTFNVSNLSKGSYIVTILTEGKTYTKNVVVQ